MGSGNNSITYAVPMENDGVQYETVVDSLAPDANQDPRYSGYEAPGANSSTTYAVPMEDDGAGRVPNPLYQSADGTPSIESSSEPPGTAMRGRADTFC